MSLCHSAHAKSIDGGGSKTSSDKQSSTNTSKTSSSSTSSTSSNKNTSSTKSISNTNSSPSSASNKASSSNSSPAESLSGSSNNSNDNKLNGSTTSSLSSNSNSSSSSASSAVTQLQSKITQTRTTLSQTNTKMSQLTSSNAVAQQTVNKLAQEKTQLQSTVAKNESDKKILSSKVAALTAEKNKAVSDKTKLDSAKLAVEKEVAKIQAAKTQATAASQSLQTQVTAIKGQIQGLKNEKITFNTALATNAAAKKQNEDKIVQLIKGSEVRIAKIVSDAHARAQSKMSFTDKMKADFDQKSKIDKFRLALQPEMTICMGTAEDCPSRPITAPSVIPDLAKLISLKPNPDINYCPLLDGDLTWAHAEKAVFQDFRKYYESKGIDPTTMPLGMGPMQRMALTNPSFMAMAKKVDSLYFESGKEMLIVLPEHVDLAGYYNIVGGLPYNSIQSLGLNHSALVIGSLPQVHSLHGGDKTDYGAFFLPVNGMVGGVIAMRNDVGIPFENLQHESEHAGLKIVGDITRMEVDLSVAIPGSDPIRAADVQRLANIATNWDTPASDIFGCDKCGDFKRLDQNGMVYYSQHVTEIMAYTHAGAIQKGLLVSEIAKEQEISEEEATVVVEQIMNDPNFIYFNDTINNYAAGLTPERVRAVVDASK